MGDVEISINQDGALKVVQHYDLRVWLRGLRWEGFGRHRAVKWPNCRRVLKNVPEAKFNCVLIFFFVLCLSLAVISLIICEQFLTHGRRPDDPSTWEHVLGRTWLLGHFQIEQRGIMVLAMFAAVLAVGVVAKKARTSAAPGGREVQTVSALVQQV